MNKANVVIHAAEEGGYWAEIPSMPGCFSQGDTLPELQRNMVEAAQCWIGMEVMIAMEGLRLPSRTHHSQKAPHLS